MGIDVVTYQFSRSKLECGDFSHFLRLYAPDKLPTGGRLREMMNTMMFAIEGYDDDSREIHSIPEIRRFYSAFHEAWPYWLYFCNLDRKGRLVGRYDKTYVPLGELDAGISSRRRSGRPGFGLRSPRPGHMLRPQLLAPGRLSLRGVC